MNITDPIEALESIYSATNSDIIFSAETGDDYIRMLQACIKDCRRISKKALSHSNSKKNQINT